MEYFVDIQAFKQPINKFIVKELAILPLGGEPITYLFKPPFPWNNLPSKYKAENCWLERNYHLLKWNSGDWSLDDIENIILLHLEDAKCVYVKGIEKLQ